MCEKLEVYPKVTDTKFKWKLPAERIGTGKDHSSRRRRYFTKHHRTTTNFHSTITQGKRVLDDTLVNKLINDTELTATQTHNTISTLAEKVPCLSVLASKNSALRRKLALVAERYQILT